MLVDEEGRSLLHKAESPEQITLLLQNPLTDVNATNRVRQASLLRIDGARRCKGRDRDKEPGCYGRSVSPLLGCSQR